MSENTRETNFDDNNNDDNDNKCKEKIFLNPVPLNLNIPAGKDKMATTTTTAAGTQSMEFVLDNKASFANVPDITSNEESTNYVLINVQDILNTVWNEIGTPFLMLPSEKVNAETKVVYAKTSGNVSQPLASLDTASASQKNNAATEQTPKTDLPTSSLTKGSQTELSPEHSSDPLHCPSNMDSTEMTDASQSQKDAKDDFGKLYTFDMEDSTNKFTSINYKRFQQNGQRLFECLYEGCGRTFSWPAHLKYHQLTHSGERQYACTSSGCKKTFYTSQRLAVHMRTHTGEKPFQCQEEGCEKAFTTAGNLKNHIRVHTGERPFVCNHAGCNRSFAEYSSLHKHKLVHTGEKPFVCYECGKMFSQSGSRTVHIKRHHGLHSKKTKKDIEQLKSKNNSRTEESSPNIFVLRNSEENDERLLQYQDFQGSESVVIEQDMSDHIVTVTTQPSEDEGDQSHTVLSHGMLSPAEVLSENNLAHMPLSSSIEGASVMVVSQPQEIVSIGSSYHGSPTDEIVYDTELLPSDLDQKDLISQQELDISPGQPQHFNDQTASSSSSSRSSNSSVLHPVTSQTCNKSTSTTVPHPMLASDEENEEGEEKMMKKKKKTHREKLKITLNHYEV